MVDGMADNDPGAAQPHKTPKASSRGANSGDATRETSRRPSTDGDGTPSSMQAAPPNATHANAASATLAMLLERQEILQNELHAMARFASGGGAGSGTARRYSQTDVIRDVLT